MSKQIMQRFIGVKLVNAVPMNRLDYNNFRGWVLPADENGADKGFLVEYIDGGESNTDEYAGYVTWSPDDVFQAAYRETRGLSFGLAIEALKKGFVVKLPYWGNDVSLLMKFSDGSSTDMTHDYIYVRSRFGCVPWVATQVEMLSDDWMVVEQ